MFLFKQRTAYEMRISDWSSDVCSSDLEVFRGEGRDGVVVALAEGEEGAVGGVLVGTESALIRPLGTFSRRREKGWVEGALGLSGTFSRGREKGFVAVEVELFGE